MNITQIIIILRLRWMLVVAMTVIGGVIAAAITVKLPKQYTSDTTLLVDIKADPLISTFMPVTSPAFMGTQLEILKSAQVAKLAAKKLGLDKNPATVKSWRDVTQGKVPIDNYYAGILMRGMLAEASRNSTLITVRYSGSDPNFTAAAANAFAEAYIDFGVELRVSPARAYANYFDERYKALRQEYEEARQKLNSAREKKGISLDVTDIVNEQQHLQTLMNQLSEAQVQAADAAIVAEATRQKSNETSVQANGTIQSLQAELSKAEIRLSEISSIYGDRHPIRVQAQNNVQALRESIKFEQSKVGSVSRQANQNFEKKVAELKRLVDLQRKKIQDSVQSSEELSFLVKEMESLQKAMDAVANRRSQLQLESSSDQPTARVLSSATPALYPSKPKAIVNVAAGVGGGMVLGLVIAILIELLDRRVRSRSDLVIDGVPFLGELGKPSRKKKLFFLRAFS